MPKKIHFFKNTPLKKTFACGVLKTHETQNFRRLRRRKIRARLRRALIFPFSLGARLRRAIFFIFPLGRACGAPFFLHFRLGARLRRAIFLHFSLGRCWNHFFFRSQQQLILGRGLGGKETTFFSFQQQLILAAPLAMKITGRNHFFDLINSWGGRAN